MITDINIPEFLADERSLGVFFLVTVVMGGSAAWLAGRSIAATWRPWWNVAFYMLLLAIAVRFIHFALFNSRLLTLHYYLVDYAVCLISALTAFRVTRVRQMVVSYNWINVRSGLFSWRRRKDVVESG